METRFETAIDLIAGAGYDDIAERLRTEQAALQSGTYRIAVVGEFKTGKSTLINRVFLKSDVLFTDLFEATAVPTEITHGPDPMLEIIPRRDVDDAEPGPLGGPGAGARRVMDPDPAAVRDATSAASPDARAALAAKTERVRLLWPSPSLAGLTIYDTPGINSVNAAVVATTYTVIPESDVVLLVTGPRQLSTLELDFLSGRVFGQGITRLMTVITYDPAAGTLTDDQKRRLMETVASQLASVGQAAAPVVMVNLRAPDETPGPAIRERIEGNEGAPDSRKVVEGVIEGLLGKTEAGGRGPVAGWDPMPEASAVALTFGGLEDRLIDFIRDNVRPGRLEKAEAVLQTQVGLARTRCVAELTAMDRTAAERQVLLDDYRQQERAIRAEYETLSTEFSSALSEIEAGFRREIVDGLEAISRSYIDGFDTCEGLGELQDRLNRAEGPLKAEIEALFVDHARAARDRVAELARRYSEQESLMLAPWEETVRRDLAIDGGFLANVPPFAVLALDYSLFAVIGPFRPLARVLVRILADEIPLLNRILPANMAAAALRRRMKASLTRQFDELKAELPGRIGAAFQDAGDQLRREWAERSEARLESVRKGLEGAQAGPVDADRRTRLSETAAALAALAESP
jgi:hypothetical protein